MGPYMRSSRGVGAVTFLNFPITPSVSIEAGAAGSGPSVLLSVSPNPFTPSTRILMPGNISKIGMTLKVYSASGRLMADLSEKASACGGSGAAEWNAIGQPSGVYLVRLMAGGTVWETKAILTR